MQPKNFNPPETLAPYIAFYGIVDIDVEFREPYCSPPLGFCGFIIYLQGEINARLNGSLFMKHQYVVGGQITAPMVGEIVGPCKQVLVFIQPCGLYQMFGVNMSTLTNTSIPLQDFIGNDECSALIGKLKDAADHHTWILILNNFFLTHLPVFEIAPKVANALDYIHEHKGNVTVKDIEMNCFITARSLERHFKTYIGLSPKEYAKIFRFKCLFNYIQQNPSVSWDTLCEKNGYYDQSHLTRYFTRYLKMKPTDMVTFDSEFITYLLQES
jgi:AraC-like DNA-binding protein